MLKYTLYNLITGKPKSIVETSGPLFDVEGVGLILGEYSPNTHYIDVSKTIPSPTMKSENPATIAGQTISNIHNPSVVDCGDLGSFEVIDGVFDFEIDIPGEYEITVKSVPYFDKTFVVTV